MMDYKIQLSTAQLEPPEEQRRRFEIECEFVQALANPHYVNFLAQRGFLKEQHFINYLKYLLYWKQPEYARALKYPQCLHILECLQCHNFREALTSGANAKFIEDQQVLQWLYYLRKRQRLHTNPDAAENGEGKPQDDTDDELELEKASASMTDPQ
ncbi:hypothetical protein KIN20_032021 [Parelaphostrongylus tenuis]|uniref:Mediator of RNA polymerase II transcription subunit 31 n=1 Tax=Parelaphostrongylus tenuis TaxID=148309 RepID=A0AAD5WH76_PARTN|nr:hypothetical protein KIN20_032021 [Parelaphostrongylus tenuis]